MSKDKIGGKRAGGQAGASVAERGVPNAATEYYHSGEGMWINQYLRGRGGFGVLSESEKEYLADLDAATDGSLPDDVLYRSTDASAVFGPISELDYENLYNVMAYGPESIGKGAYADKLRRRAKDIISRTTGSRRKEAGFMSTTSDADIAESFGGFTGSEKPIVMKIFARGKARGVNLSQYDANAAENLPQKERLLARGTAYTVSRVYAKNGSIYVDVEL